MTTRQHSSVVSSNRVFYLKQDLSPRSRENSISLPNTPSHDLIDIDRAFLCQFVLTLERRSFLHDLDLLIVCVSSAKPLSSCKLSLLSWFRPVETRLVAMNGNSYSTGVRRACTIINGSLCRAAVHASDEMIPRCSFCVKENAVNTLFAAFVTEVD